MDYTILTYHGVLPESEVAGLSGAQRRYVVSAEEFAAQAEKLAPFPWNGKKGARS